MDFKCPHAGDRDIVFITSILNVCTWQSNKTHVGFICVVNVTNDISVLIELFVFCARNDKCSDTLEAKHGNYGYNSLRGIAGRHVCDSWLIRDH